MSQGEQTSVATEALVKQIRGEIVRLQHINARKREGLSGSASSSPSSPAAPPFVLPPRAKLPRLLPNDEAAALEKKAEYDFDEFLAYEDVTFLHNIFRALLNREPDGDGALYYMKKLRAGELTKSDILVALARSDEARERNIVVHGLRKQYLTKRMLKIPVLGKLMAITAAIWRLPGLINTVNRLSTQQAKMGHEIPSSFNDLALQTELALLRQADYGYAQLRKQADYLQHHKASVRAVIQLMDDMALLEERLREISIKIDQGR